MLTRHERHQAKRRRKKAQPGYRTYDQRRIATERHQQQAQVQAAVWTIKDELRAQGLYP